MPWKRKSTIWSNSIKLYSLDMPALMWLAEKAEGNPGYKKKSQKAYLWMYQLNSI